MACVGGVDLAACEGECEVVTGRRLGADLVISGDLSRVGSFLKLGVRLHDIQQGRLISIAQASGANADALDRDLDRAMRTLLTPLTRGRPPRRGLLKAGLVAVLEFHDRLPRPEQGSIDRL